MRLYTFLFIILINSWSVVVAQKAPSKKWTFKETSVEFMSSDSVLIKGQLLSPRCSFKKTPVVLIIAGSGPTDQDGNSGLMRSNTYKNLAYALSKKGIASLRYNKRIFSPNVTEETLVFEQLVLDAQAGVDFLKQKNKFKNISLIGHSQGALVAMLLGREKPDLKIISLAGPSRNAADLIYEQIKEQVSDKNELKTIRKNLKRLQKGETLDTVEGKYKSLFRASVQHFLSSWMKFEPTKLISELKNPLLIIQGDQDLQVKKEEAYVLQSAQGRAQLRIIQNMNHILRICSDSKVENLKSYYQPNLPIAPELIESIAAFVNEN